jgi:hypothetical protein
MQPVSAALTHTHPNNETSAAETSVTNLHHHFFFNIGNCAYLLLGQHLYFGMALRTAQATHS